MNEEIKQRLFKYLDSVEGSIEKAVDFTSDQVPLYVQELCHYGAVSNGLPAAMSVAGMMLLTIIYAVTVGMSGKAECPVDRNMGRAVSTLVWLMLLFGLSTHAVDYGSEAYKAAYCPRVYVVEQIHELVK